MIFFKVSQPSAEKLLADKADKQYKKLRFQTFVAGILHAISIILFLYGGDSVAVNVIAMVLRGLAIGVLICFLGGLMAVDIVPRKASGTALGIVGPVGYLWIGAAIISFILPLFNWKRKQQAI